MFHIVKGLLNKWYQANENGIILNIMLHRQTIEQRHGKPFNLIDMQTAFYCLGIGLMVCVTIFFIEIMWSYYQVRMNSRTILNEKCQHERNRLFVNTAVIKFGIFQREQIFNTKR